ncbi:hypothetical protein OAE72_03065, partial [Akkermansiaceae bacterium]|nr:hypothetical protein [Akkermansiaceae bacterium]
NDIIFDLPALVMKRRRGPDIIQSKTEWVTECTGGGRGPFGIKLPKICADVPKITTWVEKTYIEVPEYENREQRIVMSVPEVEMREEEFVFSAPELSSYRQDLKFDLPTVTIRFIKDAGKKAAEAAAGIQANAEQRSKAVKESFRQRVTMHVLEPYKAMFTCYKEGINSQRARVAAFYDPEIETVTNSLKAMKAREVPEDDDDYVIQKKNLEEILLQRANALKGFDKAIAELEEAEKHGLSKMLEG